MDLRNIFTPFIEVVVAFLLEALSHYLPMSSTDEKGFDTFPWNINRPESPGGLDITLFMAHGMMVCPTWDLASSGNSMKRSNLSSYNTCPRPTYTIQHHMIVSSQWFVRFAHS